MNFDSKNRKRVLEVRLETKVKELMEELGNAKESLVREVREFERGLEYAKEAENSFVALNRMSGMLNVARNEFGSGLNATHLDRTIMKCREIMAQIDFIDELVLDKQMDEWRKEREGEK